MITGIGLVAGIELLESRKTRVQQLIDFVFPPMCVGCGRRGSITCNECLTALRPIGGATCPRCSASLEGARQCSQCKALTSLRAVIAKYPLEGLVRSAVIALKYRRQRQVAPFLAAILVEALDQRPLTVDCLAAVPLAPGRLRARGFNQSELLAAMCADARAIPLARNLLVRTRETDQQTRLTAVDRRSNVQGAFSVVDPEAVAGQRILLLDDVCTTGATLQACATSLMTAGAAGVWAVVAAREMQRRPAAVVQR